MLIKEFGICNGCGAQVAADKWICENCVNEAGKGMLRNIRTNLESANLYIHKALLGLDLIGDTPPDNNPRFGFDSIRPGQTVEDGDFPK